MPNRPKPPFKTDPIRFDDYKAMGQAASMTFNTTAGRGLQAKVTPAGITILQAEKAISFVTPTTRVEAYNIGPVDLGVLDVVQLSQPYSTQSPLVYEGQPLNPELVYARRILEVLRPQDHCFSRFGVCVTSIPKETVGEVVIAGVAVCKVARANGEYDPSYVMYAPDHADTVQDQTYLQIGMGGSAEVLWIDDPFGGHNPWEPRLAVVRFGARRAGGVGVSKQGNDALSGIAEVIVCDESLVLTSPARGVVEIALA